jgi:hypothetical protein
MSSTGKNCSESLPKATTSLSLALLKSLSLVGVSTKGFRVNYHLKNRKGVSVLQGLKVKHKQLPVKGRFLTSNPNSVAH